MAVFNLTFGGVPLTIDTREYFEWQEYANRLDEERLTLQGSDYPGSGLLGITRPLGYPGRPKLKPGTFFYPCGASRWAEGIFVVTQTEYDQIIPQAVPDGLPSPLPLVLQQGTSIITTPMYLLQARPLARFGVKPGLYLLQLVDERYFWQYSNTDSPGTDSWDLLIASLTAALGISLTYTSPSATYGLPNPLGDWQTSGGQNAAVMMDAVMFNLGLRFVRNLDATYQAMTVADSIAAAEAERAAIVLAGGDFTDTLLTNGNPNLTVGSILPNAVEVQFQKAKCSSGDTINPQTFHLPYSRNLGDIYSVTTTITDAGYPQYTGFPYTLTIRTLGEAYYDDSTLLNGTDLDALALQLSQDYYASQVSGLDELYPSIYAWTPEGLHDILWTWSAERCQTRVQRLPVNIWSEIDFLHHFAVPDCGSPPPPPGSCPCPPVPSCIPQWVQYTISWDVFSGGPTDLFLVPPGTIVLGIVAYVIDAFDSGTTLNVGTDDGVAAYDNSTTYNSGDQVESGGNNYVCIATTTGNAPPNATYWVLLGPSGSNPSLFISGFAMDTTAATDSDNTIRLLSNSNSVSIVADTNQDSSLTMGDVEINLGIVAPQNCDDNTSACLTCSGTTYPVGFKLVITGFTGDCSCCNGTFILLGATPIDGFCLWDASDASCQDGSPEPNPVVPGFYMSTFDGNIYTDGDGNPITVDMCQVVIQLACGINDPQTISPTSPTVMSLTGFTTWCSGQSGTAVLIPLTS